MAITSLNKLPVELLMHIAGYVAAPLFELRSNRHKIMASYMVARRFFDKSNALNALDLLTCVPHNIQHLKSLPVPVCRAMEGFKHARIACTDR